MVRAGVTAMLEGAWVMGAVVGASVTSVAAAKGVGGHVQSAQLPSSSSSSHVTDQKGVGAGVGLGAMRGFLVGARVGLRVGRLVGAWVGARVGARVGGFCVGAEVTGLWVGVAVTGRWVGAGVAMTGADVGAGVGAGVAGSDKMTMGLSAAFVGSGVEALVGAGVTLVVGASVAALVGATVGEGVVGAGAGVLPVKLFHHEPSKS